MTISPIGGHSPIDHDSTTCALCDEALDTTTYSPALSCTFCGDAAGEGYTCASRHAMCEACATQPALDVIHRHCMLTTEHDPLAIADVLMRHPSVRLSGADHHYLVPAALIAAYSNVFKEEAERELRLREARILAECVHDGHCGSADGCGAATGSGIFFDVLTKTSEYSDYHRQWSIRAKQRSLERMERDVRTRCCKLDTSLAIEEAALFLIETHGVNMEVRGRTLCGVSQLHRDCLATACPFNNHAMRPGRMA